MFSLLRKALAPVSLLLAIVSVAVVRVYQATLSPDHGPLRHLYPYGYCRHEPTCSEYAVNVLQKKRYPVAVFLILRRILSCNPWRKPTDEKLRAVIAKSLQ